MDTTIRPSQKVSTPKKRIFSQLETFATVPVAEYGDSFSKIKKQIPDLLTRLGLPTSQADIRAAVILSRCQIDINEENLSLIKELDGKLLILSNSFHPKIAVNLLAEGQNPLDMPLDKLQLYIDSFNGKYGKTYILSDILNSVKGLPPIIRSAVISVYKAIHRIRRGDGAVIAYAQKSGSTGTLGELLSVVSLSGVNDNVNYIIDNNTPIYEQIPRENIREEIERACAYSGALLTT